MCKAYPGGRCKRDATAMLRISTARYDEAMENLNRAYAEHRDSSQVKTQEEIEFSRAQINMARADASQAESELQKDKDMYFATAWGFNELQRKIDAEENPVKKLRMENYKTRISGIRELQKNADRLLSAAKTEWKNASDEDKKKEAELSEEARKSQLVQRRLHKKVSDARTEELAARRLFEDSKKESLQLLSTGREVAYDKAYQALVSAYEGQGIERSFAEHYATDSLNSRTGKYVYYGPNSIEERMPVYDDISPKVKGEGHEHHLQTVAAVASLETNEDFQKAIKDAQVVNKRYNESVKALVRARNVLNTAEANARTSLTALEKATSEAEEKRLKRDFHVANIVSPVNKEQFWTATPQQFVASSYQEPDGSVNAHVLFGRGTKTPMFVRVKEVHVASDKSESFVMLENGHKIASRDLSKEFIRLTKPSEGSTKIF